MVGVQDFPSLIRVLHGELGDADDHLERRAHEVIARHFRSPYELIDWARRDRHWSYTLARVMRQVWSRPSELAARLLVAIVEQMREEQQTAAALEDASAV